MPFSVYVQGLTMGLAYVAPIGAQNLFVMQSAIGQKRSRAILTALIVIFFDVTLALACFCGAGALMSRFPLLEKAILLIGSGVVIWIGIGLLRTPVTVEKTAEIPQSWGKIALNACVVTWFNPQAIIDGTMMLGAFRATLTEGQAPFFMLGSASASCLWFFGITLLISIFRSRLSDRLLLWINRICGGVMIFYGVRLLISLFEMLRG